MTQNICLIVPVLLPVLGGLMSFRMGKNLDDQKKIYRFILFTLIMECIAAVPCFLQEGELQLWYLTEDLLLCLRADLTGKIFAGLVLTIFTLVCIYAFDYLCEDGNAARFFGFYLILEGMVMGLCFSDNLVTYYLFFECMTLVSVPLILHDLTHRAVMASLKYLFYSLAGAMAALAGIFFLSKYGGLGSFQAGGLADYVVVRGHNRLFLVSVFLMIIGFGTKAGMFPMHAWLPTAHPEAPAPASAILSGIITKMGILGIIRGVYFIARPDLIRGTWVQYVWMILSLVTVFLGSMMAYREQVMKKRLAYSTVSQAAYILFGLSLLNKVAFVGAILHVIFHAMAKDTLFLGAGAVIHKTGKTRMDELKGIGKQMPLTIWCFTLVSITLIGIPPTGGFLSKWDICVGALQTNVGILSWIGPVILLVSALLTAGYLLPVTIDGFFPGADDPAGSIKKEEPSLWMTLPMILMTILAVIPGMFPTVLLGPLRTLADMIL